MTLPLASWVEENCATALFKRSRSVSSGLPIEEELHLLEKLHPNLLHHNEMRSLADLDEPLVWATRKLVEERLRTLAGSHPIHSATTTSVGIFILSGS